MVAPTSTDAFLDRGGRTMKRYGLVAGGLLSLIWVGRDRWRGGGIGGGGVALVAGGVAFLDRFRFP